MPREFRPTDSKELFVGRQKEIEQILGVMRNGQTQWIVHVSGNGGIGKTRLLETLRKRVTQNRKGEKWLCTNLIDFFKISNQTTLGLLSEISRQLGKDNFAQFEEQRGILLEALTKVSDASQNQEAIHRVTAAFFNDWKKLLERDFRLLLLFDTCEEMHALTPWVTQFLVPRLNGLQQELHEQRSNRRGKSAGANSRILAVFAGREQLTFPNKIKPQVLEIELPPLSLQEMKEFFRQAKFYPGKLKSRQIEALHERCGGRPLYVALTYDWLKNDAGLVDELIDNHGPFGEKLVGWITRLKDLRHDAIQISALAWRRMEPSLLAKLLDIPATEAEEILLSLSRFSFVKYRAPEQEFEGSFQLHDEMRELMKRHFLSKESSWSTETKLREVIEWYELRIDNRDLLEGKELPGADLTRALLAEYVYYQCELDPNAGARIGETLFRRAVHFLDLSLCELLNHEIGRYERRLSDERIDQLRFQQALVAFRQDDYPVARQIWSSLIRRPICDEKLRATSHLMSVELEGYTGNYDDALQHAEAAERIYYGLLGQSELTPERRELMDKELRQLYKNWGYIYRVQGQLDHALEYYQKSLTNERSPKNVARGLNDIGYAYFLKGDTEQATSYVSRALDIRLKLGIPYECGLSHNTLGMIMEGMGRTQEAAELFHKAFFYFEAAGSDRGLALVRISLGQLHRSTNDFDEALENLMAARKVLEEVGDTAYLIVALNEIGTAHRQQATPKARKQAEEYFLKSFDLSEQINNHRMMADNLEDLHILYYQWARDLRNQGNMQPANDYLQKSEDFGERARAIAKAHNLTSMLAKIERTTGDVDFERQDYEKAFYHFFSACEILARAASAMPVPSTQFQRRLTETANRMQQSLYSLPQQEESQRYAEKVISWIDALPAEIIRPLSVVKNLLVNTMELSRIPLASI